MAKITRKTQKIFADSAPTNQLTTFGTAMAVTPNNSRDLDDIQNANFSSGWAAAVEADKAPYEEDTNGLFYLITKQLAYIFQAGVSEWDSATTYYINSYAVGSDGEIYKCLVDNCTAVDPTTDDGTKWANYITDLADKNLSNLTTTGSNKFDGQWTDIGTGSPIANEITITTTATQLDVSSYLPNDGNSYLVLVFANFKSSTAYTQLSITGSNTNGFTWGVRAGAANVLGGGSGLCLVDSNRKISLQTVSQSGTATLYLNSAKRLGS